MRHPRTPNHARQEACLKALRAFVQRHGRAPTAGECGSGGVGRRVRDQSLPHYASLVWHFGSFRRALLEAGISPRAHGVRPAPCSHRPVRRVLHAVPRQSPRRGTDILDPRWAALMREIATGFTADTVIPPSPRYP